MTNGETMRDALAIVTALGGSDWTTFQQIIKPMSTLDLISVMVALAGLSYGLAERAAEHEDATVQDVLMFIGLDMAEQQ